MYLVGTHDGVFRAEAVPAADPERTLDCGRVWELRAAPDAAYAATEAGLYRSTDGADWSAVGLDDDPTAVLPAEAGVLVGTRPTGVLRGDPGGDWLPVGDLAIHPHSQRWRDRAPGDEAHVRTLAVHPEAGILAGLEPGGVYAFDGEVWRRYGQGVHDDVHDLTVLDDGAVVAATGNGLYRTDDGETWYRLDTDFRDFWANYFREAVAHGDRLYAGANLADHRAPGGAVLSFALNGEGADRAAVPTDDPAFPVSWVVDDGDLFAGTMRVDDEGFLQDAPAALLRRTDEDWETVGRLPAGITSLASTP